MPEKLPTRSKNCLKELGKLTTRKMVMRTIENFVSSQKQYLLHRYHYQYYFTCTNLWKCSLNSASAKTYSKRYPQVLGEPFTWFSALVIQPKPRFSKTPPEKWRPNIIRGRVELGTPNKFMERSQITHGSIIKEFISKFHDCQAFSKLDLRQGYHQELLHPESRQVVTFCTP